MTTYKIETDDQEEFDLFYNGPDYHSALYRIVNEFRSRVKHSGEVGSWEQAYQLVCEEVEDLKIL